MSLQSTEAVLSIIYICYCILHAKSAELKTEDLKRNDPLTQSLHVKQREKVPKNEPPYSIEEIQQRKKLPNELQDTPEQLEEQQDEDVGPKIHILNPALDPTGKTRKPACAREYVVFEKTPNILAVGKDKKIQLSTDFGSTWHSLPGWSENMLGQLSLFPIQMQQDTVYKSARAYLFSKQMQNSVVFFTDDAGETWAQWNLDSLRKLVLEVFSSFSLHGIIEIDEIKSSAASKNVFMISIHVQDINVALDSSLQFLSVDHGLTWKLLGPADTANMEKSMYISTTCEFVNSLGNHYIKSESILVFLVNEKTIGKMEQISGTKSFIEQAGKLHISYDLGKTWCLVDDLQDEFVTHVKVTDLYLFAITVPSKDTNGTLSNLYVSNNGGQNFQKIEFDINIPEPCTLDTLLPINIQVNGFIVVIYQQVTVELTNKCGNTHELHKSQFTFMSDSTGLNYYLIDQLLDEKPSSNLRVQRTIYNIPGCQKTFMLFSQYVLNDQVCEMFATKVSYDYGASWCDVKIKFPKRTTTANLPNSEGTLKLFAPFPHVENGGSPLSQTFALNALVSTETCTQLNDKTDLSTFMTRDGGESFELSMEVPSKIITGTCGKIVMAIPQLLQASDKSISEIYYSFNQGRSWESYELNLQFIPAKVTALYAGESESRFLFSGRAYAVGDWGKEPQKQNTSDLDFIIDFSSMCSPVSMG